MYILSFIAERLTEYQPISLSVSDEIQPAFNILFRTLGPNILLLVFGMLSYLGEDYIDIHLLWLIVPTQCVIRILFNWNRLRIFNWPRFIISSVLATLLAYGIGKRVLVNEDLLFPEIQDMEKELWLVVILYLYMLLNTMLSNNVRLERRLRNFIRHSYGKMKQNYGATVDKHELPKDFENFIYAVMISERFNHPLGVRISDRIGSFFKFGKDEDWILPEKYKGHLLNSKSVDLAIQQIRDLHQKVLAETKRANQSSEQPFDPTLEEHMLQVWHRTAWFYNRNNNHATEVCKVFDYLNSVSRGDSEYSNADLDRLCLNAFYNPDARTTK